MILSINDFAQLLLVTLAQNSNEVRYYRSTVKTASFPFNYRQRIENILCANNGWKEEFSVLIDTKEYFEDHFWWEERLSAEILKIAKQYNKNLLFDLVNEQISIEFDSSEVDTIIARYKDDKIIQTMKHFASLLTAIVYSRRHEEEFVDYTARSRKMMHELVCKRRIEDL